jgi:hypothetical protein
MTTNDTSNYNNLMTQVMQTDRDVLNSQFLNANAMSNQTDTLKQSVNDTTKHLDNSIGVVGRDVLVGTGAITREIVDSNSGQTNTLKQSMNDIARFTDNEINSLNRDVLKGHSDLTDSFKNNLNANSKFTDNMINNLDQDLLKGNFQVTDTIKNTMTGLGDKIEDRFSNASRDLLTTQFMQTNDLKNNLAQIDKDIYKSSGSTNENIKDVLRDVNTSTAQLSAQQSRDLTGVNNGIIDKITNATDRLDSSINHGRAQTDAQFFNSADRLDRSTADLKSAINAGMVNDVMLTKETQREIFGGVNSIERQSAAQYAGLQREIDRNALFQEHRHGDFRRDYFEQTGRQNRHAAEYHGVLRHDISEGHYRTENEILRSRNQIEVQAAQNYANIQIEALKNKDALSIQSAASLTALQNQNAQNYANIQIEAFKNKEGLASQAAQNYANSQIELLKSKDALALQTAQGFAASQLEASKNTSSILDKLAECCCEVKETVLTTSAATQDAVKNSELAAVRQQLTAEQTKNYILQTVDKH